MSARHEVAVELAVDVAEEAHLAGGGTGEPAGGGALLVLASGGERDGVGERVPRALRSVGAHEVMDRATGGGPLRERRAASELDVVGMGADRERGARHVEVAGPRARLGERWLAGFVARSCERGRMTRGWINGWVRSATVSRSSDSSVSWRTVTWRPLAMRRVRDGWRNEPRP